MDKQTITIAIADKQYDFDSLSEEAKKLISRIAITDDMIQRQQSLMSAAHIGRDEMVKLLTEAVTQEAYPPLETNND